MGLTGDSAAWKLIGFGVLLFIGQIAACELGYRLGGHYVFRPGRSPKGAGALVATLLGLLALVLAFTLSFSNTRFNERRNGSLAEASAIGTAWLRAQAVDHPRAAAMLPLMEEYAQLRVRFLRAGADTAAIEAINGRTDEIQSVIWGHTAALVRERTDLIAALLMTSVNAMFDASMQERFAYAFTIPPRLIWLLTGMVLLGMLSVGFQLGARDQRLRALVILLIAMWTVVIVSIFDLAAPRATTQRLSGLAHEWTIEGFRAGVSIPPLPPRP